MINIIFLMVNRSYSNYLIILIQKDIFMIYLISLKQMRLKTFFRIEPTFVIYSGKNHFNLAKEYSLTKGSRKSLKYIFIKMEYKFKVHLFIVLDQGLKVCL
uniref:LAGLIDADG endonuclease n=1 Tax=Amanita thiersii TaxID=235537 RepID=A0A5Q0N2G0_9AGAR|nr:LAGLIDADG endonuclease [Amanita thiersii]QFZ98722.1 LAGLIDADG endonuclease [Amanita thiersii]